MLPKGYTLFKFLLQDRTTVYFLDPLLPDRVWFLPFCSQTGVFKLRKMLPDRVKITAPQRHTPVHIRTKCPPPGVLALKSLETVDSLSQNRVKWVIQLPGTEGFFVLFSVFHTHNLKICNSKNIFMRKRYHKGRKICMTTQ